MGAHSFMPSRLSVNHRRQSRRRHRHRHRVENEQPQLNPNAARCSMILKKFLFIFKQSEEGERGQRGRQTCKRGTAGARPKELASSQVAANNANSRSKVAPSPVFYSFPLLPLSASRWACYLWLMCQYYQHVRTCLSVSLTVTTELSHLSQLIFTYVAI